LLATNEFRDEHLRQLELRLGVEIANRGHVFRVIGERDAAQAAERILRSLYADTESELLSAHKVHLRLQESNIAQIVERSAEGVQEVAIKVKRGVVKGRGPNQARTCTPSPRTTSTSASARPAPARPSSPWPARWRRSTRARCSACRAGAPGGGSRREARLPARRSEPEGRSLPAPAVRRAVRDARRGARGQKLLERNVIEIAPLAYMRGRTLNDAFVILDEAQNTTIEQMKMFLTRLGFGSTAVVTGDLTQIDLPKHQKSGLRDAIDVLRGVEGISFTFFTARDVVRHPLVARIVRAYDAPDSSVATTSIRPCRS
jgi:phosphate starvation-inducible PhoH-like protein